MRMPQLITDERHAAVRYLTGAYDDGHEGLMAKALDSVYAAGSRGADWRKIKQVHTLDLVVIAAEWGSGRRKGWLSNLHLAARDGNSGEFVMLGKTFKGLTDKLLKWQTREFLARELSRDTHTVHLRPELVVEIAVNDIQESQQYPAGMALRFARVKRYRQDKTAEDADTVDTVRELFMASRQ
jgi:DNA ligase-1